MFKQFLNRIHLPRWLEITLGLVFLFRVPSFFEPFSYGDEMIYLTLGEGVRRGLPLYLRLHDNKPPLLYLIAAIAGNVFWFKVILAFWMLVTIVLFWKLASHLFKENERLVKVATFTFAILSTLPLLEGNIANAELFLVGPVIFAFWILFTKKKTFLNLFLAGVLFAVAALFKFPAAFELPVILFFWLITKRIDKKKLGRIGVNFGIILLGFVTLIALTAIWYFLRGALPDYLKAAFLQNIGYLSSWRPTDVVKPFWLRNLPLLIRGGIVVLGSGILFVLRKKLSKQFIFLVLWLLFGLFAVTLSERPYPHYLIQILPATSLLVGIMVAARSLEQALVIIPLALVAFVPVYYKYYYYQTFSYYTRFVSFASGQIGREEYFSKFDNHVLRNYQIAEFIGTSSQPDDPVFVWGDASPIIYALSRRLPPVKYTATYHILDYDTKENLLKTLNDQKPKFVVLLPESPPFEEILEFLAQDYLLLTRVDGAQIWYKRQIERGQLP